MGCFRKRTAQPRDVFLGAWHRGGDGRTAGGRISSGIPDLGLHSGGAGVNQGLCGRLDRLLGIQHQRSSGASHF